MLLMTTDIDHYDDEDARGYLRDFGVEPTDENVFWLKTRRRDEELHEFWKKVKALPKDVYFIEANLGLWYGRRIAWNTANSLYEALCMCNRDMDDLEITEDRYGKLKVIGRNHDGTNFYTIYRVKNYNDRKPAKRNLRNVHLAKTLGYI